jgi:archaellum component FlaG (FlaF/FlaG flagellin family)
VRSGQTIAAGQSIDIQAQPGVSLRISASAPSVSRTRLSSDYGYPPAHGYYLTFTIHIVNTGSEPIDIGPTNFHVHIAGEGTVTSYDGNAPYSGASSQLDATEIDPGQSDDGPLTFDVRRTHGTISYLPDKSAAVSWRF